MRKIFQASGRKNITIKEEILLLEAYSELENLRFSSRIKFKFDVDSDIAKDLIRIPPMLLQPLVENSIQHGLKNGSIEGTIVVSFELSGDHVICKVSDSGAQSLQSNKARNRTSALDVIQNRMEILSEATRAEAQFTLTNETIAGKAWTVATLKIPLDL